MGHFESILPEEIVQRAVRTGDEFLLPKEAARRALEFANDANIAVLGVELFQIVPDGLKLIEYSPYEIDFERGHWPDFVRRNNQAAAWFIEDHAQDDGYGYILNGVSEDAFDRLDEDVS